MTVAVDLKAYWDQVSRFLQYPEDKRADGYSLGLLAEAGEVCGVVDKYLRGQYDVQTMNRRLVDELGDLWFYITAYDSLRYFSSDLTDIAPPEWMRDQHWSRNYSALSRIIMETATDASRGDDSLQAVARYSILLIEACGTTLQDVLDQNVAKLEGRWVIATPPTGVLEPPTPDAFVKKRWWVQTEDNAVWYTDDNCATWTKAAQDVLDQNVAKLEGRHGAPAP